MSNNWYIGQEIVSLRTSKDYPIKKGEIFTIKALKISNCRCKNIDIHIGFFMPDDRGQYCSICWDDDITDKGDMIAWQDERDFAPLEYNKEAIEELLKTEQTIKK